jgi:hypothetical protein
MMILGIVLFLLIRPQGASDCLAGFESRRSGHEQSHVGTGGRSQGGATERPGADHLERCRHREVEAG